MGIRDYIVQRVPVWAFHLRVVLKHDSKILGKELWPMIKPAFYNLIWQHGIHLVIIVPGISDEIEKYQKYFDDIELPYTAVYNMTEERKKKNSLFPFLVDHMIDKYFDSEMKEIEKCNGRGFLMDKEPEYQSVLMLAQGYDLWNPGKSK